MKFTTLAKYLEELENTSSRIEITKILSLLFKKSSPEEIDKVVYLILGRLAPQYEEVVFNFADKMMLKALAGAYGLARAKVAKLYKKQGDLGDVAFGLSKKKSAKLSVTQVFLALENMAQDAGEGSVDRKVRKLSSLLGELDKLSSKYVVRVILGRLRLGFSDKTVLDALSWMEKGDKSGKNELESAYRVNPDVGSLAREVKKNGIKKATANVTPKVGRPVLPMLAQRLKDPKEMIAKMGKVAIEPKLDGLRTQIHVKTGKEGFVKAYTRNLNEISWMFPELKEAPKFVRAKEVILDCEAVGVDLQRQKLANFQTTMTRRRKHEIGEKASKVPIQFFVFDILTKDGKNLMDKSYLERRRYLEETVVPGKIFNVVRYLKTTDPEVISGEEKREADEGLEGIIVKRVSSGYVPGRTGWRWVKMKEPLGASAKLEDTLDLIVMGATSGRGKRTSFGVGQFLVGILDRDNIKTVTKVGTGLTDEQFRELDTRLKKIKVAKKPRNYSVPDDLGPDIWVEPKLVVEIAADEITRSPKHTAGYALRFPRLINFRDDKDISQATTSSELKDLFKLQK